MAGTNLLCLRQVGRSGHWSVAGSPDALPALVLVGVRAAYCSRIRGGGTRACLQVPDRSRNPAHST
jgi:hypothetical protein